MAKRADLSERLVIQEAAKRQKAKDQAALKPKFVIEDYCFDEQISFIRDATKFKTGVCSRRAGKTIACAADLVDTVLRLEGDVAYITLNRRSAKRIIWRELVKINKTYDLGADLDNTELTLTFPNGNVIYVSGASDESEIEKFRGQALRKVYIDECQSFKPYLEFLIDDVIEPALTDYDGSLILIGTPGPVPAGYFYKCATGTGWSHHFWTLHNNPFLLKKSGKTADQIIQERADRRGIPLTHPSIQREYFGQWAEDKESLVFSFDPVRNVFQNMPEKDKMQFILGADIGYVDADAIAVLGYNFEDKHVYLVEELVTKKQDITSLVGQVKMLADKYKPVRMVMDAGALGKKIQEEIRFRHGIHMEAAEKNRKLEFIELLNDDLRTGRFKAMANSRFGHDAYKVQWDKGNPQKPKIADTFHTDIGDAVLYAWRECKHYLAEKAPEAPKAHTDAYMKALEEKEADEMEQSKKKGNIDDIVGSQEDMDYITSDIGDIYE